MPEEVGRIVDVQFGVVDGVFGLHLRIMFSDNRANDYTLVDVDEIRAFMETFNASNLRCLLNRKLRMQRYPIPLGPVDPL